MFCIKRKSKEPINIPEPKEVTEMKRHTRKASNKVLKNSKQLNELLRANGITLQIHRATTGHNHA